MVLKCFAQQVQNKNYPLLIVMEFIFEKSGKKRKASRVTCTTCQVSFLKRTSFVGEVNYCSDICLKNRPRKEKQTNCAYCNLTFHIKTCKLGNSKSGLYFCSRQCKDKAQRIGGIKEIQPSHYGESRKDYRSHCFKIHNLEKICVRCGYDNELAICVHHIDRNRSNNKIDNLEVLCYNCHAVEHFQK